jgi:Formin Homology 2 Domain
MAEDRLELFGQWLTRRFLFFVSSSDENALSAEQMENIIEYLPTSEERRALEAYMLEGSQDAAEKFEGLCECEKFMVSMMTVKHAKRKVRALLFKLQFEGCIESLEKGASLVCFVCLVVACTSLTFSSIDLLRTDANMVETACDELKNSARLRKLLGIVLSIGNRLNTAGAAGKRKAGAFSLNSLLKLSHAKAFDKKTTFLHYVVLIVQRNNEILLNFKDDIPTALQADKLYWDQCLNDLEEVEHQLENLRRIALYQARLAQKFRLNSVKKTKPKPDEDGAESLSDESMTLEEEVEALRSTSIGLFTLVAIKKVSTLRDKVETTKVKFAKLLEYFGEESKRDMQPHELFGVFTTFCRDFDKAKEHVLADEKMKVRI